MEHSFGTAQGSDKATPGKICQFKLMLLGESNVGKSCLAERFPVVQRETGEVSVRTLGWDLISRNIALDGTAVKLVIWDTTGQKRFRCVISMYYRGAQAAIVVYDITNQASFERAKAWVRELQEQASSEIVIALAGNKCDLTDRRVVKFEEAQSYAEENGLLFMETSVRTAMNVNNIFLAITRKLLNSQSGPGQGTWLNKCCK